MCRLLIISIICLAMACCQSFIMTNSAFVLRPAHQRLGLPRPSLISSTNFELRMSQSSNTPNLDDATKTKIENILKSSKVVLFMKGNKQFPQCGFSNTACRILQALNTDFTSINVLDDDNIRQGIKTFSMWPTIPQLYINGEFIGGSDIMIELYQSGELAEKIEFANAN